MGGEDNDDDSDNGLGINQIDSSSGSSSGLGSLDYVDQDDKKEYRKKEKRKASSWIRRAEKKYSDRRAKGLMEMNNKVQTQIQPQSS